MGVKSIKPCIRGPKSRNESIMQDKDSYRWCNRIEIMFIRLNDCCCVTTHYDRRPTAFFSATLLATSIVC